ncbi:hypothetical protein DFH06DRAFT_521025 [Mycena polygramma]|nr:hypothetical protein DFH06DRAFT_521025 [Mycena polygramma]
MNRTIESAIFEEGWSFAMARTIGLCVGLWLYGILLILLSMAAYVLYHWTGAGRKSLAAVALGMAILTTADFALLMRGVVLELQRARLEIEGELWSLEAAHTYRSIFLAKDLLFVTNSLVTDSFFIYRCFIIWGRNIRVVVGPLLMLLGSAILGYLAIYEDISESVSAYHIYTPAAVAMGLATNLVVMGLTAGRIWWIRRDASVLKSAHVKKYNTVLAIILESGAIYCISTLLYLIASSTLPVYKNIEPSVIAAILETSMPPTLNIAPTLTIVRVGLRRSGIGVSAMQDGLQEFPTVRAAVPVRAPTVGVRDVGFLPHVINIGVNEEP